MNNSFIYDDEIPWRDQLASLRADGKLEAAVLLLRPHAHAGDISAMVQLALGLRWLDPSSKEVADLLDKAEKNITEYDLRGHLDLHMAYSVGVWPENYEHRAQLAFKHLVKLAELRQAPEDLLSVGLHYRDGLNCVEKNLALALVWLSKADDAGSPVAALALRKLQRGKHIP
jgi:TPR repeat protein